MKMESQIHLKLVNAVTKYFESSLDDDITKMVPRRIWEVDIFS